MVGLEGYSKYEITRIVGARALQIAMNAPLLIKIKDEDLEKINYDALKIAEIELNSGILPISINRPFPKKKEGFKKIRTEKKVVEQDAEKIESKEEEEIAKEGEIMEIANPEDEIGEEGESEEGEAE
ncbi:MAG TPA: DNA-directed RNA polymerase subunit K [Candidatus Nanoarchaeia archaeon]|nr:DNA-directed RNA polymerase subunit K [Candidatus Nanoarchaeia archaeon]